MHEGLDGGTRCNGGGLLYGFLFAAVDNEFFHNTGLKQSVHGGLGGGGPGKNGGGFFSGSSSRQNMHNGLGGGETRYNGGGLLYGTPVVAV